MEILRGIVEAVGMIDAQAIHFSVADELQNETMGGIENRLVLHSYTGQVVDVEEAAIVDVVRGHPPACQPVSLSFDELMQSVETAGIARGTTDFPHVFLDELRYV